MKIYHEGKTYIVPESYKVIDFWKKLYGDKWTINAGLASVNGDVCDFYTSLKDEAMIKWIPLSDERTIRAYQKSLILLLALAMNEIYKGKVDVTVKHTLGRAIYCEFSNCYVPRGQELQAIERVMKRLAKRGGAIERKEIKKEEGKEIFLQEGKKDIALLLEQIQENTISLTTCLGYTDYFPGYLIPDISLLVDFTLKAYAPGFLIMPLGEKEEQQDKEYPLFAKSFLEAQKWTELIGCRTVIELNQHIESGKGEDIIAMTEALQEKKMAQLADLIKYQDPHIRLIAVAGPSSSGKTTFTKKLLIHLRVNGLRPLSLSLDDFFRNRDEMGDDSWEDPEAIDLSLFEKVIGDLLSGKETPVPHFNFLTGKKEWNGQAIKLEKDQPIVVEGLHALNPKLTSVVPGYQCMHVYLSVLMPLVINNHNRVSTADTRLLRRLVRDVKFRGNSASYTLNTWPSVREGEEKNIFAFQNRADFVFNSALLYEISVLKKWVVPLLKQVKNDESAYSEALRLLEFLQLFRELDDGDVPDQSLLREFIGKRENR